ncbi:hypothetical protein [Tenacibaculum agarivorans]|uniref:hypothetical protein n=1 Tax=Tenacibaculum agarivorans TaxID=1908389 RepID=UPI00094BC240|nr:hypothetical protein [Tenacibaculum agarivorans]
MKKTIPLLLFIITILCACSSVKTAQKAINSGDYEKAITLSIKKLTSNKTKEKNQPYVVMLEEAFQKATERDQSRISFLEKQNNTANLAEIYDLYRDLNYRQERIRPLLPLRILKSNRQANFDFKNYDDAILKAKEKYVSNLYTEAQSIFKQGSSNKIYYRKAHNEFAKLDRIYPDYKNTSTYLEDAHNRGTDYVFVSVNNDTDQIIPRRLEDDLLAIDTYGLNDFWTVYHAQKNRNINYDFDLELNFRSIEVSPEQIKEREVIKERKIKDGHTFLLDDKGKQVKDSLGNKIKVDKFITVRCRLYEFTQFKSSRVTGVVRYIDNKSDQIIERFPIESEFIFEHSYADYDGDKRALDDPLLDLIRLESVRFPSNEQMVYDTGTDLKERLKRIISRNKFRN